MTNLINKAGLVAALNTCREGLQCFEHTNALLADMGLPEALHRTTGALTVLESVLEGVEAGSYDATLEEVLDEAGLTRYSEVEDLDTEDMDDLAPEEVSVGIVMLPPSPSPEERAELVEFYLSLGFDIEQL
jgi:hypothetical protein